MRGARIALGRGAGVALGRGARIAFLGRALGQRRLDLQALGQDFTPDGDPGKHDQRHHRGRQQ